MLDATAAKQAAIGTVVVLRTGIAAQKHGDNRWFIAQDWELPCTDAEIVGWKARVVATPKLTGKV